ncbi:MAG: transposase [Sphingomonadales bacterium]|nr:transposase [Sphingomonadales bacterium]
MPLTHHHGPSPSRRDPRHSAPYHAAWQSARAHVLRGRRLCALPRSACRRRRPAQAQVWSYCLMPNHVHIVLVPSDEDGLWRTFRRLHRDYTGFINARMRTTGHLWQGRYGSVAMDEAHFVTALRYIALNALLSLSKGRCGRGLWRVRRTGRGRARGRCWRGRTITSSPWRLRWSGWGTLRRSLANPSTRR